MIIYPGGGRCYNLKNDKEASEVTEGKSSRVRWENIQANVSSAMKREFHKMIEDYIYSY